MEDHSGTLIGLHTVVRFMQANGVSRYTEAIGPEPLGSFFWVCPTLNASGKSAPQLQLAASSYLQRIQPRDNLNFTRQPCHSA
jgi:hypothetical protein